MIITPFTLNFPCSNCSSSPLSSKRISGEPCGRIPKELLPWAAPAHYKKDKFTSTLSRKKLSVFTSSFLHFKVLETE